MVHLCLIGANLLYGLNYSIAKVALPEFIPPRAYILLRVLGALSLFTIVHRSFIREKIRWKDLGLLALCGLFGVAINQLMFFEGLARTTEINAALIMITTPIFVLLISSIVLKESVTKLKVLGITIGAIGAAGIIMFGNTLSFGSQTWKGDLFIMINAISYGIYLVLVKSLMKKYHPITIICWVFFFGALVVVPLGIGPIGTVEFSSFTPKVWASLVYVIIGTTFFAYLLNITALRNANPSLVSTYIYSQPLIATITAVVIGSDQLVLTKILGGILIFIGVYLVSLQRST